MKYPFIIIILLLLAGCQKKNRDYVIVKYEWGESKSIANSQTALYTIRHGNILIHAEYIGSDRGDHFQAFACSPPLPVDQPLFVQPDGHELVYSIEEPKVHLEVISEEIMH